MDYFETYHDLYEDIQKRTEGEIYIGVLGPVRSGKSTFIKRFMELMVLPNMEEGQAKIRAKDEMPQSASGKTIMTTEPKFIPNDAAEVIFHEGCSMKVRLIDCVGYMVDGASGHMEGEEERMVKTPWFDYEIPFTKAAAIGTDKVMNDHSTIGLVITTDGSIGEFEREKYEEPEEKTILALKKQQKPFIVLMNCKRPYANETVTLGKELSKKYGVLVMPVNCEQLKKEDINEILKKVLFEFPIASVEFFLPKWVYFLPKENNIKKDLLLKGKEILDTYENIRHLMEKPVCLESDYIKNCKMNQVDLSNGVVQYDIALYEQNYYEMLSDILGEKISDEGAFYEKIVEMAKMKMEYQKVNDAFSTVNASGYGVVKPNREEIILGKPELIKHGNKYGVKICAKSPSVHLIRAGIETEIAPIVGTKEQAEDLLNYINEANEKDSIWETNIFGKNVEQLVCDGITSKLSSISGECQMKLQDTMQKIVNDTNGGMVCIII